MAILLTGGSGMVGRNLRDLAGRLNVGILAPSSQQLNLLDYSSTLRYLREVKPDLIIHAAGRVGGIQANMSTPVSFLIDNWQMGSNLVQAARQAGVEKLVNLGSSCMYPRGHAEPLREEQVLSGELEPTNEGYAIAKCAVARLCDYVRRETPEFKYKTIIPCNLYGRYDHFKPDRSHLIAAIIHKLHIAKRDGHKEVEIWGDGSARREFMWAGDLATALMRASENFDTLPDYMNIGLGHDYSVDDYYRVGASAVGYEGEYVHNLGKPVGMQRKLVDVVRARNWGWSYQTELEDGLRATYEHYLELETFR